MSLNGITSSALSGLQTAQTALSVVSNNVTNLNTAGYVREVVNQSPLSANGPSSEGQTLQTQHDSAPSASSSWPAPIKKRLP